MEETDEDVRRFQLDRHVYRHCINFLLEKERVGTNRLGTKTRLTTMTSLSDKRASIEGRKPIRSQQGGLWDVKATQMSWV